MCVRASYISRPPHWFTHEPLHSIRPNSNIRTHTSNIRLLAMHVALQIKCEPHTPTIPWTHTNVPEFVRNRKFINVDRKRLSLLGAKSLLYATPLYHRIGTYCIRSAELNIFIVLDTFSTNTSSPQSLFSPYCCHWCCSLFFVYIENATYANNCKWICLLNLLGISPPLSVPLFAHSTNE